MMRVLIATRARIDIRRNAEWWATNHSRAKAEEWFYRVYEQLKAIADSPLGYGLSDENALFPFEIREALVGLGSRKSYRAIFRLQDASVTVYRVLRAAEGGISVDDLE